MRRVNMAWFDCALSAAMIWIATPVALFAAAAPAPPPGAGRGGMADNATLEKLAEADRAFGFDLLGRLTAGDTPRNLFISPASVAMALAMTINGAAATTRDAMAQTLRLKDLPLNEVNAANAALLESWRNEDPKIKLTVANSLWGRQGITFKPPFIEANRLFYGARLTTLDFAAPAAPTTINRWVSEATAGRIEKMVDRIDPQMILYLLNAIYFKGAWTDPFDKAETHDAPFHLPGGGDVTHPRMVRSGKFAYFETSGFQAILLTYGIDRRLAMRVFLPREGTTLPAFLGTLGEATWRDWAGRFTDRPGRLELPRFKMTYEAKLNEPLKAMGMAEAFDPERADFSNLIQTPPRAFISEVKHKSFVEVNEEGAEAAAATSVGIMLTAVREPAPPFAMIVDRPFFFTIEDAPTGAILFLGIVADPR
ncbi:MAG: serpin family protein [bacterium]|nr:serpin family protein [bacterium]